MSSDTIYVGDTILERLYVRDPFTGELVNATDVDLTVTAPDGTITTPVPTNPETGTYDYYLPLDQAGWWYPVWVATVGDFTKVEPGCSVCAVAL